MNFRNVNAYLQNQTVSHISRQEHSFSLRKTLTLQFRSKLRDKFRREKKIAY